jgi:NhaD family Na+/H+ antiporter
MEFLLPVVFIIGYAAIVLEHPLKVNKAATALLTGVLCWVVYISLNFVPAEIELKVDYLTEHLADISAILFFLLCAMTIVELIDAHDGFQVITNFIKTNSKKKLLWLICFIAFFLSSILDNLTTSIVMVSLLRKLIDDKTERMFFISMVIIAANAGGAWTPIGDVTTTMLWIKGKITTGNIITSIFIPSLVCLLVPLLILSKKLKGNIKAPALKENKNIPTTRFERRLILGMGVGALVFVPVFKTITHLPPYMGILFSLGVLWLVTEILHREKNEEHRTGFSVMNALQKVDVPSVLFFLGILLAISALQSIGHLNSAAQFLDNFFGNTDIIVFIIGILSAVVDNVPLVAAAMGMYNFPVDHQFWEFLAYCAGTGGSILIIGSAAGVAVMGMEKIDFIWYMKNISLLALAGYVAGAIVYILLTLI